MTKSQQKQHKPKVIDFEEIRPNEFIVRNQRLQGILKDEGNLNGVLFELPVRQRTGLLIRIKGQGYRLLTLEDRISKLPKLPSSVPVGAACFYPIPKATENYSTFDARRLRWQPLTQEKQDERLGVVLCAGWVVRKWRSRGKASYAQVVQQGEHNVTLTPMTEDNALLAGFALATESAPRLPMFPISKHTYLLPSIPLPLAYQDIMERIATRNERGWVVEQSNIELARMLYARLGLHMRARQKQYKDDPTT